MTPEQRKQKAEQLRIAAHSIETGCEWEIKHPDNTEWRSGSDLLKAIYSEPESAVSCGYEIRLKQPSEPMISISEGYRELRDEEKDGRGIEGAKELGRVGKWEGYLTDCYALRNRRIIAPPPKPQVPLEPDDVPPGSVIRGAGEAEEPNHKGWCLITSCSETGIRYWRCCDDHQSEWRWRQMMEDKLQIKRPTDTEWQPCSKPAP